MSADILPFPPRSADSGQPPATCMEDGCEEPRLYPRSRCAGHWARYRRTLPSSGWEAMKAREEADPELRERRLTRGAEYRATHKAEKAEAARAYRAEHPEPRYCRAGREWPLPRRYPGPAST